MRSFYKWIIWSLVFGLGHATSIALAQSKPKPVMEKGTFFLGVTLDLLVDDNADERRITFEGWPRGGYLFADNWAVLLQFIHRRRNNNFQDEKQVQRDYLGGINLRRYFPLSNKFFFYTSVGYNFTYGTRLTTFENGNPDFTSLATLHQFNNAIALLYFPTPRIALESQFALLAYNISNIPYDGEGTENTFTLNLQPGRSTQNFGFFAVSYYFGR